MRHPHRTIGILAALTLTFVAALIVARSSPVLGAAASAAAAERLTGNHISGFAEGLLCTQSTHINQTAVVVLHHCTHSSTAQH